MLICLAERQARDSTIIQRSKHWFCEKTGVNHPSFLVPSQPPPLSSRAPNVIARAVRPVAISPVIAPAHCHRERSVAICHCEGRSVGACHRERSVAICHNLSNQRFGQINQPIFNEPLAQIPFIQKMGEHFPRFPWKSALSLLFLFTHFISTKNYGKWYCCDL